MIDKVSGPCERKSRQANPGQGGNRLSKGALVNSATGSTQCKRNSVSHGGNDVGNVTVEITSLKNILNKGTTRGMTPQFSNLAKNQNNRYVCK